MPFKIKQASPASRKQKEVAVDHSIKCVRTKKRKQVPSASCESSICSITVTFATLYLSKHSDVEQVYIMLKDCRACTNCTPNIFQRFCAIFGSVNIQSRNTHLCQ